MQLLGLEIIGRKTSTPSRRSDPFDERFWSGVSTAARSGVSVTPNSAVQVAAVNAAVRVISETIASLPLILYKRLPNGGKERATDHPLYKVLHGQPNQWMTLMEWMELMVRNILLRGNAYAYVETRQRAKIYALKPLNPDNVTPRWGKKDEYLLYDVRIDGKTTTYRDFEIVHFRGPSEDGVIGKGPIQEARDVVGNALALDQYQSHFYANGVRASGVLEHPGVLTDETAKRLSDSFKAAYSGVTNSGKAIVLEDGMKFNPISVSPKDAEFLEVRKFSITEIARLFRVPPHMIGDLGESSYSNIEQEAISFVVHSIRPWTVRIEQALMKTLLFDEGEDYVIEFLLDGLLRGDTESRYRAYQTGLQNGFLKLNEVRELENKNPLDWGDISMIPLNMKVLASEDDIKNDPAEPAPAEPDAPDTPAE